MIRGGAVYILTNQWHSTLYVGVTSDLKKRNYQHQNKVYKTSFTA
jgi:putative endonuclease